MVTKRKPQMAKEQKKKNQPPKPITQNLPEPPTPNKTQPTKQNSTQQNAGNPQKLVKSSAV